MSRRSFLLVSAILVIMGVAIGFYLSLPAGELEIAVVVPEVPTVYIGRTPAPLLTRAKTTEQLERDAEDARVVAALPVVALGKAPQLVKQWDVLPMIYGAEFSPDGAFLAIVGSNSNNGQNGVNLRSTADWKSRGILPRYTAFAWSPNSRWLAIQNDGVDIWDVRAHKKLRTLADGSGLASLGGKGSAGVFGPMVFSADSSKIATLGEDPNSKWTLDDSPTEASFMRKIALKVWQVSDGKRLKVRPGIWSNSGYKMMRVADEPSSADFAMPFSGRSYSVSNTQPPIYIYSNSQGKRLFVGRFVPRFPHASLYVPRAGGEGGVVIAGNAWIYGAVNTKADGRRSIGIYRTRDQQLLQSFQLSASNRIRNLAISPDGTLVMIAQDYPVEKMVKDKTYGNLKQQVSQSRVSIYRLDIKK